MHIINVNALREITITALGARKLKWAAAQQQRSDIYDDDMGSRDEARRVTIT